MLDEYAYTSLKQAGAIARQVRGEVVSVIREGVDALFISEFVEEKIRLLGGRPAFPCNVGIDAIAAHYTPTHGDNMVVTHGSLVKVDLGVEVDGYIADTAITVALPGSDPRMIEASDIALRTALKIMRPNVRVSEIGRSVHNVVTKMGFKPIKNLTGHEIQRYNLHAGVSIPNVPTNDNTRLALDRVYAVEPFVTTTSAAGEVASSRTVNIYSLSRAPIKASKLSLDESNLVERIKEVSRGLPYATRWFDAGELNIHERLYKKGVLQGYPVLVEKSGAPVAQSEHTVILREDGCEVIT